MTEVLKFKRGGGFPECKITDLVFCGNAFLPQKAFIPMGCKGVNFDCIPLVSSGETVREGQLIAESKSTRTLRIHSSIPGIVSGFVSFPMPDGKELSAVEINLKGSLDILGKPVISNPWEDTTAFYLLRLIEKAGVINTALRYAEPMAFGIDKAVKNNIDILQINLFDKCPSLRIDSFLAENFWNKTAEGAAIIAKLLNAKLIVCPHKMKNTEILHKFSEKLSSCTNAEIRVVKVKESYPLEDLDIPKDSIFQIDAASAVYTCEAVVHDYPVTSVYISVDGKTLHEPKIVRARIGTPIGNLLEECGGVKTMPEGIIINGYTRGFAVKNIDIPVDASMKSIHVVGKEVLKPSFKSPCISCGKCFNSCPMFINPAKTIRSVAYGEFTEEAVQSALMCSGCSCCSMVCPSRIPIAKKMEAAAFLIREKGIKV